MTLEETIRQTVENAIGTKIDAAFRTFFDSVKSVQHISWNDDKLLNEKEVSEMLSIPLPTLRNWRSNKMNLRFVLVGDKSVRYRWGDLKDYIRMNTVRAVDHDGKVL